MKSLFKISVFLVLFLILFSVAVFVFGVSSNQPGSFFNNGHNAIWLEHEWVDTEKDDREIQELVNKLEKYEIDTVFIHVGPIGEDGSIDPEVYRYAIEFLDTAKKFNRDIEYQAWLGQIRKKIDLSDKDIRHNIANDSMLLSQMLGFDGIHFDIEPVWDEDEDFINLLKETREMIPEDKKISVALSEFIPGSLIWLIDNIHPFENYNTEVNYQNVAKYADQIVVMAYDTSMNSTWMYTWFVKEQTIWVTDLFDDMEIFIGIPSYEEEKESFNPFVENIGNGLHGVTDGLNNFRSDVSNFAGVAIYSNWEMEDDEWQTYEDLWLK